MSSDNSNKISPNDDDIFLKCLSQFYQSEFGPDGLNYRKLKLRDSVVKAYNKKFKTKLKAFELLAQMKQKENTYQPYEWQRLFLDAFEYQNDEATIHKNEVKSIVCKLPENVQNIKKEDGIETKNEVVENTTGDAKSSCDAVACKPNVPIAAQNMDYKTMSIYELQRALLVSKLEMLDAQEALRKAKENIKLNEEEYLKRSIDK